MAGPLHCSTDTSVFGCHFYSISSFAVECRTHLSSDSDQRDLSLPSPHGFLRLELDEIGDLPVVRFSKKMTFLLALLRKRDAIRLKRIIQAVQNGNPSDVPVSARAPLNVQSGRSRKSLLCLTAVAVHNRVAQPLVNARANAKASDRYEQTPSLRHAVTMNSPKS